MIGEYTQFGFEVMKQLNIALAGENDLEYMEKACGGVGRQPWVILTRQQ